MCQARTVLEACLSAAAAAQALAVTLGVLAPQQARAQALRCEAGGAPLPCQPRGNSSRSNSRVTRCSSSRPYCFNRSSGTGCGPGNGSVGGPQRLPSRSPLVRPARARPRGLRSMLPAQATQEQGCALQASSSFVGPWLERCVRLNP